jgi:hypothetical protein
MKLTEFVGSKSSVLEMRMAPVEDAFFPTITDVQAQEAAGDRRKNVSTTAADSLLYRTHMLHITITPPKLSVFVPFYSKFPLFFTDVPHLALS